MIISTSQYSASACSSSSSVCSFTCLTAIAMSVSTSWDSRWGLVGWGESRTSGVRMLFVYSLSLQGVASKTVGTIASRA